MAYAYLTMLDLAKFNGSDMAVGLIEENLNSAPEAMILPARTVAGTSFKTLVRTAFADGQFRFPNEGVEPTKSSYINRLFETYYYDLQLEMDNAIATADEQGMAHALEIEASGAGLGYLLDIGRQFWYGTGTDAKGFPGAVNIVDSSMVLDEAAGTTATTGSSVWAVVAGPKHTELIFGRDTTLNIGEWRKQTITRNSKELTAWKNALEGWIGAAFYSKYSVAQYKDFTADASAGVTDAKLAALLALFPVGVSPTHFFMTKRSRAQLQTSRTVVITTGPAQRAGSGIEAIGPLPESAFGIPIIVTDSLTNTEALS